jgi:hypothetical protein
MTDCLINGRSWSDLTVDCKANEMKSGFLNSDLCRLRSKMKRALDLQHKNVLLYYELVREAETLSHRTHALSLGLYKISIRIKLQSENLCSGGGASSSIPSMVHPVNSVTKGKKTTVTIVEQTFFNMLCRAFVYYSLGFSSTLTHS